MEALPLVSCIMPTYGRPAYVGESVAMFLAQDYPLKELIILNDCEGQHFTGEFPNVRIINVSERFSSLGEKRNSCIAMASGSVIAVWDDDDVYLPWRLSYTVSEMHRFETPFYRPADFWAYWGSEDLHENQSVPGWVNHPWVAFRKGLWEEVGGYPPIDVREDDGLYDRIHTKLRATFIKYEISPVDRFGVMRGTSEYAHTSIDGGQHPLDTMPGDYPITPAPIRDPVLRAACDRLIARRRLQDRGLVGDDHRSRR